MDRPSSRPRDQLPKKVPVSLPLTQPALAAVHLPPGLTTPLEPEVEEPDLLELPVVAVDPDRPLVDDELEPEVAGADVVPALAPLTTTRTPPSDAK